MDVPNDTATLTAGVRTSALTTHSGDVYTWGYNSSGCLGHGDEEHLSTPRRIEWLAHRAVVTHVALGKSHTVLLDDTGQAWSCGVDMEVRFVLHVGLILQKELHRVSAAPGHRCSTKQHSTRLSTWPGFEECAGLCESTCSRCSPATPASN